MTDRRRAVLFLLCLLLRPASPAQAGFLADPGAAKAADKCQAQITKAGAKFVAAKLKKLEKCVDAILKCVQTQSGAKRDDCLVKAAGKCDRDLAKIFTKDEPKLRADVLKRCAVDALAAGDVLDPTGLGFDAVAPTCLGEHGITLADAGDVADCLVAHKECLTERLFRAEAPRALELLEVAGVDANLVGDLTCLEGAAGSGAGFGDVDPKGVGKALEKCAKESKKAGAKFATAKLKSIEKCTAAVFKCVQTKPGDAACIPKAGDKCDKEFGLNGKIAKAEAKLRSALAKKCDADDVAFGDLQDASGLHLDDVAALCAGVGVGALAGLPDYTECLFRHHECLVDEMVAVQVPRLEDLLARVGRADDVPAAFCATPTPTLTPTPTVTPTPTLSATPTPTATLTPHPGEFLLAITKHGSGTGTITSSPPGIDCGDTCAASFPGGSVDLDVETANGSDAYFQGWDGDVAGTCVGPRRHCALAADQHRLLDATFAPQDYNLVFVTMGIFAMNLGGTAPYDAACNAAATAAGLNNLAGDAFIAWVSTSGATAASRLGGARGFVRIDGRQFADQVASLTSPSGAILHPVLYDEVGARPPSTSIATGTNAAGAANGNCLDWTSNSSGDSLVLGSSVSGPANWTANGAIGCHATPRLYCLMKTKTAALVPPVLPGAKRIFTSNVALTIGEDPDARCESDKPAGTGAVKALLSTTTVPAATHLAAGATYVRPDGQVVGTGAEIVTVAATTGATPSLASGIWQAGNGVYGNFQVWTGDSGNDAMTAVGTVSGTCDDWTDGNGTGSGALTTTTTSAFWRGVDGTSCTAMRRIYCAEQ